MCEAGQRSRDGVGRMLLWDDKLAEVERDQLPEAWDDPLQRQWEAHARDLTQPAM